MQYQPLPTGRQAEPSTRDFGELSRVAQAEGHTPDFGSTGHSIQLMALSLSKGSPSLKPSNGLILRARKHDSRRLSTIRRLQFSTISPVQCSDPSAKGLRQDFTTKTDCAVHVLVFNRGMLQESRISDRNHQDR